MVSTELKTKIASVSNGQEGERWKSLFHNSQNGGPSFFDLYPTLKPEATKPTSSKSSTAPSSPRHSPSFFRTAVSLPDYYHQLPMDLNNNDGVAGNISEDDKIAQKLQPLGIAERAEWNRLVEWLKGLEMQQYVPLFHHQGLTRLSSLELLEIQDLEDIGILEPDRLPLLDAIQVFSLRTREWTDTALAQT